jgi:hypothetical protein
MIRKFTSTGWTEDDLDEGEFDEDDSYFEI